MRSLSFTILFCLVGCQLFGQQNNPRKTLNAVRIENAPTIDGKLTEKEWALAPIATDFVQNSPNPQTAPTLQTEVKVLYDDQAIYIGVKCLDDEPDKIYDNLSQRDQFDNADLFSITLDTYQNGIEGLEFIVSAAGVQIDQKIGNNNNDRNWNAVWKTEVTIDETGWNIEYKIPFAALRFPNKEVQKWNVNFIRNIRRIRELSFWNGLDPEISGFFNQAGELTGIENIESPTRLFLYPYVSSVVSNYDGETNTTLNGGMDLKYGLNDAFTLDMTLIPDFSQVISDNQVLNLTPFEVRFDENRQFFTEGVELFQKGNLFYSRRIGGQPVDFYNVYDKIDEDTEEVTNNPAETRLLNATKISGRTKKNTGIGFFNAVVGESVATISDLDGKKIREEVTNPLTNYNIFVVDQALKNNSYISFINTNVLRKGDTYDANVTGTEFSFRDKGNNVEISGDGSVSQIYEKDDTDLGHTYSLELAKISGALNYGVGYNVESDTYDRNDLGFLYNNNERTAYLYGAYRIFKPFWKINSVSFNASTEYSRLYKPEKFVNFGVSSNVNVFWKNFLATGLFCYFQPTDTYDYFEPRKGDLSRYHINSKFFDFGGWISSDYRKTFALDVNFNRGKFANSFSTNDRSQTNISISPRIRFSSKWLFVYEFSNSKSNNNFGYVNDDVAEHPGEIIYGVRNINSIENTITTNYTFNNKMGLSFRLRQYWSVAEYNDYKILGEDGYLHSSNYKGLDEDGVSNHNTNFNAFTIDTNFKWQFAPGSELNLNWKNNIFANDVAVDSKYFENLENTISANQNNSISLKVLYFVDYLSLKNLVKNKRL